VSSRTGSTAMCWQRWGMANRPLLARVRMGLAEDAPPPPRTHVLLLVRAEPGRAWIAMPVSAGATCRRCRLKTAQRRGREMARRTACGGSAKWADRHGEWLLERAGPVEATDGRAAPHGEWQAQYTFDLAKVVPGDLEMVNHWTSTRPDTRFTMLHVASVVLPEGFAALSERALRIHRGGITETREIADAADYATTLRDLFGIALSEAEVARLPLFA
ncbi:arylamine N-acetyltransferase, partial [Novosphingobium resinovorum]|uniref:arylamine N-acetyltransferase n=1 Tax=Novosphingobium resinovorum TaxID=158500 RepID=UPI003D2B3D54